METQTTEFNVLDSITDELSSLDIEFNTIKTVGVINKDKLADSAITFLKEVFEQVIIVKDDLLKIYESIPEGKVPRRYGKRQIQDDIKKQGGLISPLQRTMLKLATLKALQGNLASKGVSDIFKGTKKLTKEDLADINAAIRDFEKKVLHITKRRK
jgi:hypothetical protein